ncbi:hypothetical protein Q4Q49_21975 [Shewanella sp. SP1S1-7]|uniref:hypothetical protein n=1 Tax=unclassified Shewanella TaxID=196818 RepID=UPI00288EDC09|nr:MULTISPECIES: hypothetical protein [unclassified Shewanella]MDT3321217.1 hypothetical protein [Shewanella sp. SP1S2-4]MDT3337928.1 hypothetical protein [Shewanella sp. SP1S1-7]
MSNKIKIYPVSILFIIFLSFYTGNGYAAWSGFERITPDNVDAQRFKFKFSQIESTESFLLELDDSYVNNGQQDDLLIDKSAWLVITKLSLNKNEQELSHVLNDKLSDDGAKVLVLSKLGYSLGSSNLNILEVQLHKSQLENAYIYVGYSPEVNDGGLRYTIDVNSFYQNFLINNQDD